MPIIWIWWHKASNCANKLLRYWDIPVATVNDGWKGYLEDRRPASNMDPYLVVKRILATVNG